MSQNPPEPAQAPRPSFGKDILSGDNFVVVGALRDDGTVSEVAPCPVRVIVSKNPPRTIVLDPRLFDATGRAAPKVVTVPYEHAPSWAQRDRAYDRQLDAADAALEWCNDDR